MIKVLKEATKPISVFLTTQSLVKDKTSENISSILPVTLNSTDSTVAASYHFNELGKNLLQAAADGDLNEVNELLSNGCPFIADWLGVTPLHLAAQHNQYEICVALLKGGITKDARNKVDRSPLHLAVYEGHFRIVELLLEHGVEVDCVDMLNMTPLHWAVQNQHPDIVELLLRHNARIDIKNKFDLSPLDIAKQVDNMDITDLFQGYVENPEPAIQNLSEELQSIEQNDHFTPTNDMDSDNLLRPVIIVDESNFINLQHSQTEVVNSEDSNNESYLISICDNDENYTQASSKDPVIINLAKDINEELPQISEKSGSIPLSNLKLLQSTDEDSDNNFSAMQLLQEHGITMIPNDGEDSSILNAVMENGHSVVLTDIGKEVLNTVKQQEANQESSVALSEPEPNTVITISPEQFLSMTTEAQTTVTPAPVNFALPNKPIKRIIMKKNRLTPYGNNLKVVHKTNLSLDGALKELEEAKKTIEEYKTKLELKEMELERYKKRIHVLLVDSSK
ncbi:GA-binding protein subunit beta-1-like isoform X2 [Anthonomus grandis grandis]|nr:GA-binding protein subunit beta-1-like isoform X2 [Anthonomus grandis grandis]XP_050314234.1 GA-binding protein subunit beta-1-like isoform X2 [Anthonomus grandis grandis]